MLILPSLDGLLEWIYDYFMDLVVGIISSIVSGLALGKMQRNATSAAKAIVETTIKRLPNIRQLPDAVRFKSLEDARRSITYIHFATKAILLVIVCAIAEGLVVLWTLIGLDIFSSYVHYIFFAASPYLFFLFILLGCYILMKGSVIEPIERGDLSVARSNLPLWILVYLVFSVIMLSLMGLGLSLIHI